MLLIILLFLFSIVITADKENKENKKISIYAFNIISESMNPTLNVGDLVIVKKYNSIDEYKVKDIITFNYENKNITHRIVDIQQEDNIKIFITKGDRNESNDDFYISYENIYGKVIFVFPKLGYIFEKIHHKNILTLIISLILSLFLILKIKLEKKYQRKKIRKKYNMNKISLKEKEKYGK